MTFTLIAHRGFSSEAPENTLTAFDLAVERGFTNVELDAQLTADGIPAVIHDSDLSRTTSGAGAVSETTLSGIRDLDAGSWFSARYAGERVPTLAEVLNRYAGAVHLHLELKSQEPELPVRVADLLHAYRWLDVAGTASYAVPGLTITSFDPEQLVRSRSLLPDVRHGWLVRDIDQSTLYKAVQLRYQDLYPRAGTIRREAVVMARSTGLGIRTWGVKTMDDLRRAIASGASGTTVDWPGAAREHLEQHAIPSIRA